MRKGKRALGAGAVALTMLATSCTGLGVSRPETFRRADPAARTGGTLVIGIAAPTSVDPGAASDPSGSLIAGLVCEPLVQIDPLTGKLGHGIVESVVGGGNGTLFTIRLRKGVRFHNGKTLAAQDVVYALSRVARQDYASPFAEVLRPVAGFDSIHALPPPTETGDPTKRTLAGVRAISRTALELTLREPNAEFLRALSLPPAAPVPQRLPDLDPGFAQKPVCVGPYEMTRPYRTGDKVIELRRFAGYYGKNDAFTRGGAAYPDTIEFRIEPNRDAEMRDFKAGILDIAHVPPARLAEARRLGARFMTAALPSVEFVGVPAGMEGLDDPRVRALLSEAIDRRRLAAEVFEGGRIPADRFLPPTFGGLPPSECAATVPPGGAVSLPRLEDSAIPFLRGKTYEFKVNDDFRNRALAEAVAGQWREKLGLDVKVVPMTWDKYLNEATGPHGIGAVFRESWTPAYPSMDAALYPLFDSKEVGLNNWARFDAPTFDRRIERTARREQDDDLRRLKYLSLEGLLCKELPLIPLTFGQEEYLVRTERVGAASGSFFDLSSGEPLLRELYVRRTSE